MKKENKPAFKFFIAWPSGKAKSGATVKAYLDGDKNKEISIDNADYGYTEKLSTNGVYDENKYATRFNGERTVSVNLKNIDIKAGTHTIYVVYSEDGKDYTLTSQKFTLEKDSSKNPTDPVADNIVALNDKTLSAAYTTGSSKDSVATDVAITGTGFDGTKNNSGTFKLEFNNAEFNTEHTSVAVQLIVDTSKNGVVYAYTLKIHAEKNNSKNPTAPVADNIVELADRTLSAAYTTGSSKDSVATDVAITGTGFDGTKNNSGTFKLEFNNAGFNGARTNVAVQLTVDINKKNNAADSFTITGMKKLFVSAGNPTATNPNTFDISYSGNVVTVTRKQWVSATETKTYYYVFTLKVGSLN